MLVGAALIIVEQRVPIADIISVVILSSGAV